MSLKMHCALQEITCKRNPFPTISSGPVSLSPHLHPQALVGTRTNPLTGGNRGPPECLRKFTCHNMLHRKSRRTPHAQCTARSPTYCAAQHPRPTTRRCLEYFHLFVYYCHCYCLLIFHFEENRASVDCRQYQRVQFTRFRAESPPGVTFRRQSTTCRRAPRLRCIIVLFILHIPLHTPAAWRRIVVGGGQDFA